MPGSHLSQAYPELVCIAAAAVNIVGMLSPGREQKRELDNCLMICDLIMDSHEGTGQQGGACQK